MIQAIRKDVIVQSGGRIEINSLELKAGQHVEVIVIIEDSPSVPMLSSFLGKGKGCFGSPGEVDAFIRKERDGWE